MKMTDVLILGGEELKLVCARYPGCKVRRLSDGDGLIQQYRIELEASDEEGYYHFLLDNSMAMSSHNFYHKVKTDQGFAETIRKRNADGLVKKPLHGGKR